jgi:general secretion pathway protein D
MTMSSTSIRSAFALGRVTATLLIAAAGLASPAFGAKPQEPADALGQARDLLSRGRLIDAGAALRDLGRGGTLSSEQSAEVADLLASLDRRLRTADPVEMSIQKAESALVVGDLAAAGRHLDAAERHQSLGLAQRDTVASLRAQSGTIRASVETLAPDFIEQALADFEAGRMGRAKSTLMILTRAGVTLPADADEVRRRIFELELDRGSPFVSAEAAGLFEPGVLERVAADSTELPSIAIFGDVRFDEQPGVIRREGQDPAVDLPADAQPADPQPEADDILERSLRAGAQSKFARASQAYRDAEFSTAIRLFEELLASDQAYLTPDQISQSQTLLSDARITLNQPAGENDPGVIADVQAQLQLQRQRTEIEFENFMTAATNALAQDNPQSARDAVASARLTLNESRNVFDVSRYEALYDRTVSALQDIAEAEIRIEQAEAERRQEDLIRQSETTQAEQEASRAQQINEQLDRARALQQDLKYQEALQVLDQVLFLSPNEPAALLMKDIIYDTSLARRYNEILERRGKEFVRLEVDNFEASYPITDIVTYPSDWPRISASRGEPVSLAEPPENRRVLAELETTRLPSVRFDNPLGDVVSFMETVTQQNFDIDWQSLELLSIDEQTPVQLSLNNVSAKTVLDRLVAKISDPLTPAGWAINDGIVQIASDEVLRQNTVLVIYDIRDLLIQVPDYDDAPEIDLQSVLQSSQGGGGGGQSPFSGDGGNAEDEERDRQEQIDQVIDIIENNVDFEGWQSQGGSTGVIQEYNGNLVIRNTPQNHREISGLLSQLREQRAMQINVETRFLLVNQDFFEQIGFDLDVYFGADNNQVRFARGNDPTVQAGDFFDFRPGPDQGLQRVVTGASSNTAGAQTPVTQGVINPRTYSPIGAGQNSLGLAEGLAVGDFANSILGNAPALGVAGQFLNDIQVDFLVKATQADRRSVQLTAPRLTFTNGQIANIVVATQTAFVSQLTPVVATEAVGFDPTVSVASEGVTLQVEGTVSSDRRYVTMNVQTGVSRIDGFAQQGVSAVAGGAVINSAQAGSFIQLPTVTVTRIQTTVTVPDQGTVLLGGQRLITEFEVETGVPVVSKIPVINRFFTNRVESKEEQTLLVLIKPTILIQSEEEERNFPGLSDTILNSFGG